MVKKDFLHEKHSCNSHLIGWDLFHCEKEAVSVHNWFSPPQSLSGSEFCSSTFDSDSSDDSKTSDDMTEKQSNRKPAYTLFQESDIDSVIENSSENNPSDKLTHDGDIFNTTRNHGISRSNVSSSKGTHVKSPKGKNVSE